MFKKTTNFIFILFLLVNILNAQNNQSTYKNAQIYLKDYTMYKASNVVISDSMVTCVLKNKQTTSKFRLSNIRIIEIESTLAGRYALYGGIIGFVSGLTGSLQAKSDIESDPFLEEKDDADKIYRNITLGFTVGCALIGALIGSTKPGSKIIYKNEDLVFRVNPNYLVANQNKTYGVTFQLLF